MDHVDADKLNTDLRYRFDYVAKFLNFTKTDIQLLNTVAPKLVPLVPTAVDAIYDKLFSFDVTKGVFAKHKVNFQGATADPPDSLNLTAERIAALKESLDKYLKKVLTQEEWDDGFLGYLSHLGKVHANKADSKNIDVNYIHMNATLGLSEHILIDAILNHDLGLD
ncbi:unnamed protein product, partial [Rotaria magnacalcarata]